MLSNGVLHPVPSMHTDYTVMTTGFNWANELLILPLSTLTLDTAGP